jgi:hypothetical protein
VVERIAPNYFETGEQQECANAFVEKREPDFSHWRQRAGVRWRDHGFGIRLPMHERPPRRV